MSCFIVEAGGIFAREVGEVVEVAIVFYRVEVNCLIMNVTKVSFYKE